MNPNKNNKKPPRGRKDSGKGASNWRGLLSLICWALVLSTIFSYANAYLGSAGHQASNVEIDHSDYTAMVKAGQVYGVDFDTDRN